jgi:hypothetical protein
VPAPSNIFGSGHASAPAPGGGGAGTLPPRLGCIEVTGGSELSFHDIGGTFTLDTVAGNFIPDGLLSSVVSTVQSFEGISGTTSDRVGFLAGVFLTDDEPTVAPTPLDFSSSGMGTEFPSLESLEIGQTFYIGDGWTGVGTGVGSLQTFIVPAGATRLFLGFLDAQGFNSVPGYYGDNAGALSVCISMCENAVLNVREEPMGTALASPWPDPARSAMSVRVWIDRAGRVDVDALDLAGRRVREIASGEVAAGGTTWVWDLRDAHGRRVPAGVYVVRARTPEGVFTRRATVIR